MRNEALELAGGTEEKLAELQALSEKAEAGDKEARLELRRAVRESSPEIVAEACDVARRGQRVLAETVAGGDMLIEEALCAKVDLMRKEIAGENPMPLEVLLTERIVSSWLLVEVLESLMNAQLMVGDGAPRAPVAYLKFILGWLDSATRRYLSAMMALTKVRRIQGSMPCSQTNVQTNVQVNVADSQ